MTSLLNTIPHLGSPKCHMLHRKDPPLIKSMKVLNGQLSRLCSKQSKQSWFQSTLRCHFPILKKTASVWAGEFWRIVLVGVYISAMPSQQAAMVRNWAVPCCCRHKAVAVQSSQCKIETPRPPQRLTKAGGWWLGWERGDTAVSRAYTSPLNMGPPYICCSLAPVSARSEDKRGAWCPSIVVNFFSAPF